MLPQPLPRLCFWLAGIFVLAAPFLPDALGDGSRGPWILSWDGKAYLLPVLGMAGAAFSGGWTSTRESAGISWTVAAWTVAASFAFPFWMDALPGTASPALILWIVVPVLGLVAILGSLMLTHEIERAAAWARGVAGALLVAGAAPFLGSIDADRSVLYALAAGGAAMVGGELAELIAAPVLGVPARRSDGGPT